MRDWTLLPGDPLSLTIAADSRFCTPDAANDHIWELELGGGDPPALALHTTYGLRARSMRIFPRFHLKAQAFSDPALFATSPCLRRFTPGFFLLEFSPFPGLDVTAEYWVPDSHAVAGRLTVVNHSEEPLSLLIELCGQLVPLEGESLAPTLLQSAHVLAGRSADLVPVIFMTGGPQAGPGPYPSLVLDLALAAGSARTQTWVQAALADPLESLNLARRLASVPWDAQRAGIEMIHGAQVVDIHTGDQDWDAAFAFTQRAALGLFLGAGAGLPHPSGILSRHPDLGFSPRGDGQDYSLLWSGLSPLEAYFLAGLLPGAVPLAAGLVKNFLAVQQADGSVDTRPGLTGQGVRWLAAPFLAALAWKVYNRSGDESFLTEVYPPLLAFHRRWFDSAQDRDGDGFPEWDHPVQAGLEDHPAFTLWHPGSQGVDITAVESPVLAALLNRSSTCLAKMAALLGREEESQALEMQAGAMRLAAEECWQAESSLYHYRDRDTHCSPAGRQVVRQRSDGERSLDVLFSQPLRLLVQVHCKEGVRPRPEIILKGRQGRRSYTERIHSADFTWGTGVAAAVSRGLFTTLTGLDVRGLGASGRIVLRTVDLTFEDISLFLPLWAGIPTGARARLLVQRTLFDSGRFGRPFGIPYCLSPEADGVDLVGQAVHMPWNHLVGEGLLAYDLRAEAALLTARLMTAVITQLKRQRAFARAYHAELGDGLGERHTLHGLAPLDLFLQTLGVEIRSPRAVVLSGKNPFPWTVTVQYRGLMVTRQAESTQVTFPDGQSLSLADPTDGLVCAD